MKQAIVDVMLHTSESLQKPALDSIVSGLLQQTGVSTASYTEDRPHLMIVKYDSEATNSLSLLNAVVAKGIHAKLIGL